MDLPQFLWLLKNRSLWLPRLDLLDDPFEGAAELRLVRQFPFLAQMIPLFRRSSFVSCWTENEGESMALWRIYGKTTFSVAIKAVYSTLRDMLPSSTSIGKVRYVDEQDFGEAPQGEATMINWLSRKHTAYAFEKEVRVLSVSLVIDKLTARANSEPGMAIEVDPNALALEVRSHPLCPSWFFPLLEKLCEESGFKNAVRKSRLDASDWSLVG